MKRLGWYLLGSLGWFSAYRLFMIICAELRPGVTVDDLILASLASVLIVAGMYAFYQTFFEKDKRVRTKKGNNQ
jgi:hypothetical protein